MRQRRRRATELRDYLASFDRTLTPPAAVDPETREKLAALGYLGGVAAPGGEALPDPKAQLPTLADLRRAADHLDRGELTAAVPLYRSALDANPRMLDGWLALADVLRRLGRVEEAVDALRRAYEASGGDVELARQAAAGYELLGRRYLEQQAWEAARDASRQAVALEDERPLAWNHLGVARHQLGERLAALEAWERAVELDGAQLDVLYNLGTRAAELGRAEQAKRALESFVEQAPAERYRRELRQARVLLARLERR